MRRIIVIVALLLSVCIPVMAGEDGGLLDNFSFEDGLTAWTVTDKVGDKVVCQGDKNHNDHSGLCGFLMKGNADSQVRLKQRLSDDDIALLTSVSTDTSMAVRASGWRYSESVLTKLTIKLIIRFTDGTQIVEKTTSLGITSTLRADWILLEQASASVPQDSVFKSVTIKVIDKSKAGKQWIDDLYVRYVI